MPRSDSGSLWSALSASGGLSGRSIRGADASVVLGDLESGTSLGGALEDLRGRSVLLVVSGQLAAALAIIELDGVARRIVLCTPDLASKYLPAVMAAAEVDAVVSDHARPDPETPPVPCFATGGTRLTPLASPRGGGLETEWVLLTSGTTGMPKLVVHTLATLAGPAREGRMAAEPVVWSTFYDIRRYGGMQILLRALLGGTSLVLSHAGEAMADFLDRAGACGVTHILGTPTHWWLALTNSVGSRLAPRYVRLSGEIVEQAILDRLRATFPDAALVHAFASTEAGVGFEVHDGLAGFPADVVGRRGSSVEIKVEDGSLRLRSARIAFRYLGPGVEPLAGPDGFVDTRDLVELRGDRYYFVGRRDGVINVGGQKIHPEEVEAVINAHPRVRMSRVRARKNPITGAIVVAELVLNEEPAPAVQARALKDEILQLCRSSLPRHKVPTSVTFVPSLAVTAGGKIDRNA
jgi:acyl-CoA synthetase (AMP-forming)/AMP-acid ligase II